MGAETEFFDHYPRLRSWRDSDLPNAAVRVLTELEADTSGCGRWLALADEADVERLVRFVGALFEVRPWCNCQSIPGSVNYPGLWHVRGGEPHYPCSEVCDAVRNTT